MILTRYVLRSGNAYIKITGQSYYYSYALGGPTAATLFESEEEAQKALGLLKIGNMIVKIVKRTIVEDEELPEDADKTPYVDKPLYARYNVNGFADIIHKYLNK